MSMLLAQCEKLRNRANDLRERFTFTRYGGAVCRDSLAYEAASLMEDAADTIEGLRNRLTETCRNADARAEAGGVWHSPRFECSECGAAYVMSDCVHFCPNCGRRVV